MSSLQLAIIYTILIILLLFIIGYATRFLRSRNHTVRNIVSILYRQCARWAVAAEQDDAEIIRVLHANYATGYLWAIKDIVSSQEFYDITGEDFLEFERKIVAIQDNATQQLVNKCSESAPIVDPTLLKAIYRSS